MKEFPLPIIKRHTEVNEIVNNILSGNIDRDAMPFGFGKYVVELLEEKFELNKKHDLIQLIGEYGVFVLIKDIKQGTPNHLKKHSMVIIRDFWEKDGMAFIFDEEGNGSYCRMEWLHQIVRGNKLDLRKEK